MVCRSQLCVRRCQAIVKYRREASADRGYVAKALDSAEPQRQPCSWWRAPGHPPEPRGGERRGGLGEAEPTPGVCALRSAIPENKEATVFLYCSKLVNKQTKEESGGQAR